MVTTGWNEKRKSNARETFVELGFFVHIRSLPPFKTSNSIHLNTSPAFRKVSKLAKDRIEVYIHNAAPRYRGAT